MKKRIEELRQRIREATGQNPVFGTSPDCPPEVEEAFLERALAYETSPKRVLFDLLVEAGIDLPRPRKLTDKEITTKLWDVIHALLARSVVIGNTDHLTDRDLYVLLWNETLRDEYVISVEYPVNIDMTKTGVDDGMPTYLKYYASEVQREMYREAYPDAELPDHVEPPPRRDHLIPDVPPKLQSKSSLN